MPETASKRGNQEGTLCQILAVVQHIQREVKQLKKEQRKSMAEIDDLKTQVAAQTEKLAAFQTASQAATDAITKEIQQVKDLVANATDLAELKAGVSEATAVISQNNDAIGAATAALTQSTSDLTADDA